MVLAHLARRRRAALALPLPHSPCGRRARGSAPWRAAHTHDQRWPGAHRARCTQFAGARCASIIALRWVSRGTPSTLTLAPTYAVLVMPQPNQTRRTPLARLLTAHLESPVALNEANGEPSHVVVLMERHVFHTWIKRAGALEADHWRDGTLDVEFEVQTLVGVQPTSSLADTCSRATMRRVAPYSIHRVATAVW